MHSHVVINHIQWIENVETGFYQGRLFRKLPLVVDSQLKYAKVCKISDQEEKKLFNESSIISLFFSNKRGVANPPL